jgi:hypothetical protein
MLRYDVVLDEEQRVTLNIDWAIDSILNVSDEWVGLMPTSDPPANHVRSLALRMGGQIAIIFVGLRKERDYLAVYGYFFDHAYRGGEYLLRSGEVHVAGARDEVRLRDLVRFVAKGKRSASILPIGTVESAPSSPVSQSQPWLAYAAGASAVGAFVLGGFSLSKEYGCNRDPNCKYAYPRAAAVGYTSIGVGVALGSVAVYLLVRDPRPARLTALTLMPSSSGAIVSWGKEF